MMAKIPIVTPKSERIVRNRLDLNALVANRKLSKICLMVYMIGLYAVKVNWLVGIKAAELRILDSKAGLFVTALKSACNFLILNYCLIFAALKKLIVHWAYFAFKI
jgi:hypothetical protein